jgi:hypothetical protein
MIEKLREQAVSAEPETVSGESFEKLPAPVERYLRLVLKQGQPVIRFAEIEQEGEFFLNGGWIPFRATEYFSTRPAGLVWDASMALNFFINVNVLDSLIDGKGSLRAKVLDLVTIADAKDSEELDAAAWQRFLAEAPWFPTALVPGENLSWSEADGNRAFATRRRAAGADVSLEFRFNEAGEVAEVFSPARFREIDGRFEPTPWLGKFRNYEDFDGMLIPTAAEVGWLLPEGEQIYWKGRIVDARFRF